jgi:hypothetical protein
MCHVTGSLDISLLPPRPSCAHDAEVRGQEVSCSISVGEHVAAVRLKVRQQRTADKTQHGCYGCRAGTESKEVHRTIFKCVCAVLWPEVGR